MISEERERERERERSATEEPSPLLKRDSRAGEKVGRGETHRPLLKF